MSHSPLLVITHVYDSFHVLMLVFFSFFSYIDMRVIAWSVLLQNVTGEESEVSWQQQTIQGTSEQLEKRYLRLTSVSYMYMYIQYINFMHVHCTLDIHVHVLVCGTGLVQFLVVL